MDPVRSCVDLETNLDANRVISNEGKQVTTKLLSNDAQISHLSVISAGKASKQPTSKGLSLERISPIIMEK
jgi:hypothetical protein